MSPLVVYHYPKCSTCAKAIRWLSDRDIAFRTIDITAEPPSAAQLEQVAGLANLPSSKLFNTSGVSYREGKFGERIKSMSDRERFAALAADGKLIKRPLVIAQKFALVGFSAEAYEAAFSPD
jgi:arsenate reductase